MQLLLQFSRRFMYRHPGQLLLALTGIAAGIAVVTGVALLRGALLDALDSAGASLTGPDHLQIIDPSGPIDELVYARLATTAGAPELIPVIRARTRLGDRPLELLAIDPMSVAAGGPMALTGPATGALIGNPAGALLTRRTLAELDLAPGEFINLRIAGEDQTLEILAAIDGRPELDNRLLMDLATAQSLLRRQGELSEILAPASAAEWLYRQLPDGLVVRDAGQRRDSAQALTAGMRSNLTALSLLALVVGLFVVYSVLSFLLIQRRRQIGMLRAVGVSGRQVGTLVALETLVLAGLGGLLGMVLGTWLSERLLVLVQAPLAELYGLVAGSQITPSTGLYLAIWSLGILSALACVGSLLREALAIPPGRLSRQMEAKPGPGPGPGWRTAIVLGLFLLGTALISLPPSLPLVLFGLFLLLCALALLIPPLLIALLRSWQRLRSSRIDGRAVGMLATARQRLGPAAAALAMAMALSLGIAMMVMGFRLSVADWVERLLRADVYLTLPGGQIDAELVEQLATWPELSAISSVRQRELPDGRRLLAYELPDPAWDGFDWLAGGDSAARTSFHAGRAVLLSEPMARSLQTTVGDTITLPTPGGTVSVTVVGIYRDYASERGAIAMDGERYREWFADPWRDSLGLYFDSGEPDDLLARLQALDPSLALTRREQVRDQTLAVFDRTFRITWALALLVGVIAAVALISALLALGLERARDYATLRALGLTPKGLLAWVLLQTASLALAAALLALPISLLIHAVLSLAVQPRAFGWSVDFVLPWQPWLLALPLALLIGLVAGLYPAWKIARADPARSLKDLK
jgi:putative ABC transport system permease protein